VSHTSEPNSATCGVSPTVAKSRALFAHSFVASCLRPPTVASFLDRHPPAGAGARLVWKWISASRSRLSASTWLHRLSHFSSFAFTSGQTAEWDSPMKWSGAVGGFFTGGDLRESGAHQALKRTRSAASATDAFRPYIPPRRSLSSDRLVKSRPNVGGNRLGAVRFEGRCLRRNSQRFTLCRLARIERCQGMPDDRPYSTAFLKGFGGRP
jgi:hypothetical protein